MWSPPAGVGNYQVGTLTSDRKLANIIDSIPDGDEVAEINGDLSGFGLYRKVPDLNKLTGPTWENYEKVASGQKLQ